MEAKRINISTFSCACFKKTEISKQLNVRRMTVHWVEQYLKGSESQKGLSLIRKTLGYKIRHQQKGLQNNSCQKKKILASTVFRIVKRMEGKSLRRSKK